MSARRSARCPVLRSRLALQSAATSAKNPRQSALVCETIAELDGLGQQMLLAARVHKSADIFVGVALLGAIGVIATGTLSAIESRLLRWRSR